MQPQMVEIEVSDTVHILKKCIEDVCGHPAENMKLCTNSGRAMMDDREIDLFGFLGPCADIKNKEQISEFDQTDISTIMLDNAGHPLKPRLVADPDAIRKSGLVPASLSRDKDMVISAESAFRAVRSLMGLSYIPQSSTPVRPITARRPLDEPILHGSKPKSQGGLPRLGFNCLYIPWFENLRDDTNRR